MLHKILSIAGRTGLYRLVNQGKNMLIVENIADGRRSPAYAHDKVISLGDISIYTDADDVPLPDVLEMVKTKTDAKPVDIKKMDNKALRDFFTEVLPSHDRERVYTTDIRKLLQWYNSLLAAGLTEFKAEEKHIEEEDKTAEAPEAETTETPAE